MGYVVKNSGITILDASIKMALKLFNANLEKQKIEEKLNYHEEKYRKLFECINEEVHLWEIIHDAFGEIQTWRLVDANPTALNAWGKTREETIGKTTEHIWPDSNPVEQFMPIVKKIYIEKIPYTWESYFSGTNQTLLMTSVCFGEYFFSIGIDISKFKKQEKYFINQIKLKDKMIQEYKTKR
ncbi:MAG TPA: PAS domain-containing protein [Leptospiraceae bacterium]|nr:PAS domain-containing protein [Leptospiraceae bacterium]HNE08260.1 PAS domain-containing protein [Leptospiraceae bacterium]HNG99221.1 PAS domain-containing protein [Leptospiraceae bacterium]